MIPIFRIAEKTKPEKMPNLTFSHSLFLQKPQLLNDYLLFEQKIITLAKQMNIDLSNFIIDHLALRVNTLQSAKYWLTVLEGYGRILSDNLVNGRTIVLFQLREPLMFCEQEVDVIELPFPKNKCYPKEGWEHIEIIAPFLNGETTMQWIDRIQKQFSWNKLSTLQVKVSEPKVEGEQLPNPSIAVSLIDKLVNHTCIKVHPYNIKDIIKS